MHPPHSLAAAAIHVALSSVSVFIVAKVLPGIRVKSFGAAVGFAITVAVLNVVAWHLLARAAVPVGPWLARGIGGFVLNGVLFSVGARIVGGVKVSGCIMAAIAAFCVTFLNHVLRGAVDSWVR